MFNFEKLETWQKAIAFAGLIYEVTRNSKNDYARFLEIAAGSLFEVVSQSFISRSQGFLSQADFQKLYAAAEEQGKMLSGLRRSILEKT